GALGHQLGPLRQLCRGDPTALPVPGRARRMKGRSLLQRLREKPEAPLGVLLFIVMIGGWEASVRLFDIPKIVLPPPSAVAIALWQGMTGDMAIQFAVTAYETLAGFVLGALFGLVTGALVGQFPLLERTLYPYIVAFQTL